MKILKSKLHVLVALSFLGFVGWWLSFQRIVENQSITVQWFGGTYGVLALMGAIIGLVTALKWGGFKTILGKALMFVSLGLLFQEFGQLILTYYIYGSHIQIPYPSWGDVAYFGSTLSYICGGIFLTKAVGIKFSLKNVKYKAVAFLVPAILLAISYAIFLFHHQYDFGKPLTVFLDLGYPIGDAIYISLAVLAYLLSSRLLGGVMKPAIIILICGLFLQYVADFNFLYQSSRGTYLAGKYADLLYLIAYFVTTTAMVRFYLIYSNLKASTNG
ncbi:MAG TPA: hypothetical protein VLE74_00290 [Candidatus Saccharimonadales bacterium]|nr:hypothetical protein [Candidatus Saccharimonadales bacterium]